MIHTTTTTKNIPTTTSSQLPSPLTRVVRRLLVSTDGASRGNPGKSGAGAVVTHKDRVIGSAHHYIGSYLTNNEAEYEGLLLGIETVSRIITAHIQQQQQQQTPLIPSSSSSSATVTTIIEIEFLMDSKLVVEQMSGRWRINKPHLQALKDRAVAAIAALSTLSSTEHVVSSSFRHIPRASNAAADRAANVAVDTKESGSSICGGLLIL